MSGPFGPAIEKMKSLFAFVANTWSPFWPRRCPVAHVRGGDCELLKGQIGTVNLEIPHETARLTYGICSIAYMLASKISFELFLRCSAAGLESSPAPTGNLPKVSQVNLCFPRVRRPI
jgi:hypothetical protein